MMLLPEIRLAGNHAGNSGDPRGPAGQCAARQVLHSPFNYDGAAGSYSSGRAGLPTYGKPGSDFPNATAGVILPAGTNSYASFQLKPNTVYYLLPGVHIGSLQADENDAFVGGLPTVSPPSCLVTTLSPCLGYRL